ncbi:MAG: recombinase RecA [Blastocatellia bacterium]|nr:recombinase RecA [Blastocatellia bacterium]
MAMEKSEKTKAVEAALLNIEKQFGKGAIMRLGDHKSEDVPVISTSSIGLDAAIGVGGFPRGRVIEIFGPESSGKTTLALHVVAQAQKAGGIAAYIDAKHALDAIYAEKLGVNINDLFVSQPDSGEQALEIAESLVRSNAVDALVIDSVAALTPRAELEGDMGDSLPGLQARLMSQALRKLTAVVGRSNTCLIFINQIREKIGVMFGCFHYNARVTLADGTTEKIGKIVNQRMPVEVLSFNPQTGAIEPRRVVNWFNNGPADYFLQFEVEGGPSGRRCFGVTPNHTIFTPNGEVAAGDLRVGDEVLSMVTDYYLTDDQIQILLGGVMGDGSLRQAWMHTAMFRVGHSPGQEEYLRWKHQMLAPFSRPVGPMGRGLGFDTYSFPTLLDLRQDVYDENGERKASPSLLNRMDARGVAVWYGDDGSFGGHYDRWGRGKAVVYNKSLKGADRRHVIELFERLGIGVSRDDGRGFWFNAEQTMRLHQMIASYLHPALDCKLHPSFRGQFGWRPDIGDLHVNGTTLEMRRYRRSVSARISKIYVKPPTRSMNRFDLEIEGNHSYMVDGVIVHNSPETTTGGRALKFYSTLRLDIRRITQIKDGENVIGNRTKVKVVKNKVAPPFREAEFDIVYGEGISKLGELIDIGVENKIVDKAGAWFSYKGERLGQGRDNAKNTLRDNPAMRDKIEAEVRAALGIGKPQAAAGAAAAEAAPAPAPAHAPTGRRSAKSVEE